MFKGGEWIEIVNFHELADGTICYVQRVKDFADDQELYCVAVRNKRGGVSNGARWLPSRNCYKLPNELEKNDLNDLIDWALDERDEDTFMRLTGMKVMADHF